MFRLFKQLPARTARTHAACVSFSFIYNVKQQGSFYLPIHTVDGKSTGSPFGSHRRLSQLHLEFTLERRLLFATPRPSVIGFIVPLTSKCQAIVRIILQLRARLDSQWFWRELTGGKFTLCTDDFAVFCFLVKFSGHGRTKNITLGFYLRFEHQFSIFRPILAIIGNDCWHS
jgi:hypothetical protein